MKELELNNNKLTELSELDLTAFCQLLNNIKPNELEKLNLNYNELTNINFIQENTVFKNIKIFFIGWNKITDITNIKYLNKLEYLGISNLNLYDETETIKILKTMKNLESLWYYNTFKIYTYEQLKEELTNVKNI